MTKAIGALTLGLSFVLALQSAYAQTPAPTPAPTPPTGEKAGSDESLQTSATGDRPWAAGVSAEQQKQALAKFREGNELLNNGLFARASESYKTALTHWK